jgi:excisionase family DNA binding protein
MSAEMSVDEVAALLEQPSTVRRLIAEGRLEADRHGRQYTISGEALARFMRSTRRVERAVASHSGVERAARV